MGLKVAPASLHWSQPSVPQSPPSCSQTLASAISSPSSRRRSFAGGDGSLICRLVEKSGLFLGANPPSNVHCSRSCGVKRSRARTIRKALSASFDDSFSDDEFSKQIQELLLRFQMSSSEDHDDDDGAARIDEIDESRLDNGEDKFLESLRPFDVMETPEFLDRDEIIPANIERKANSFEIPMSLRMIKRKKQWQEGVVGAGESAYCSMKKAFSSMVFIIRELHSYTLQMRSNMFYEDMQGIVANVQKEMHASFVWLFQKVFSKTPTLMVYVMILLANYSVYSMSSTMAAALPLQSYGAAAAATEEVSVVDEEGFSRQKFDSSIAKTMKLSSLSGKTASVGGNNGGSGGGGGKSVASGTDGDGRFDESNYYSTIAPDSVSSVLNPSRTSGEESVSNQASMEGEEALWNSIVEEAAKIHAATRDGALDQETMKRFVSPVVAKIEEDDRAGYFRMELLYRMELAQEPNNPLLLANFAQFLYLVVKDLDRAEEYFKKATKVEPKDAEALNKYANFLWVGKKDLWAAEETYLEAIAADPSNTYYAGNYAHFLWNTGGEDTCFPLSSPDAESDSL